MSVKVSLQQRRYTKHRCNARARGIPFLLTFDEWWRIWQESGHWDQYGNRRGQHCMARYGDKGAYEVGNVRICLNEENRAERNQNYPMAGERNPAYGKHWQGTAEQYEALREATSKRFKGKPKSAEQRAKMAIAARARWDRDERGLYA